MEEHNAHAILLTDHGLPGNPGELEWFIAIMRRLLGPEGCPWDREQTLETLRPFLIEECYEVLDAIAAGDPAAHQEELGDLLLQIVFQSELARLEMAAVIRGIGEKLIRRHPHVFGEVTVSGSDEVLVNWDKIKAGEKGQQKPKSALAGVPRALPALHRSHELVRKAARVGFRWPNPSAARTKAMEELAELDEAVAEGEPAAISHEAGDLLWAVAVWVRELGIQPEDALRQAADRFERRFGAMEAAVNEAGNALKDLPLEQQLARWQETKSSD